MQIHLADFIRETPEGKEAKALLRKCVRCGFCIATCPTYQLLRNDHDSPRGRIDIVKQVLEGSSVTAEMRLHLDRCLLCRLCETTCPSGVQFGRLLAIARGIVQTRAERPVFERLKRKALRVVIPRPALFNALVGLAQLFEPFLPASWKLRLPTRRTMARPWPQGKHGRRMLLVEGCVQPALSPATNPSAARVLDRLGITLVRALNGGCCGAVSLHLDAPEEARELARCNIDAWWPHVEQGIEAIITTTSACSTIIKDYGYLLARDAAYSDKARRVAELPLEFRLPRVAL